MSEVDFSAVAADHGAALHTPPDTVLAVAPDEAVEDELAADADDAPFDLAADVAHPTPGHAGPAFDVARDIASP
ncbi:hypothetical protein ABZS66_21580 [Dactylosporangium sp. NPDC005572]|uniref:hypothetical protein n=1 Tax=Dactylosporangium sp. NPDC005572 TaxID=3156889 RepID=UPI0033B47378